MHLPLSPKNKIDSNTLPEPCWQNILGEHVTMNKTETLIAAIWQEILGIEHIGPDAHFYQCGGNSLQLLKVHALLVKALVTEFDVSICVKNLELSKLGVALEQVKLMGIQSEAAHIQDNELLPLTVQQKSMYLAYSKDGTSAYNIPIFIPINVKTNTADIESLLSSLVKIHPALGMKLVVKGGHLYQKYIGANNITIPILRSNFEEWEECKLRYSAKLIVLEEHVLKASLISVDSSQLWLALNIHQFAIDCQSIPTLLDTIKKLLIGKELKPNYGFISHVHWQQSEEYKILHQKQVDYWTRRLAGLTNATNLPYQYTPNQHRKAGIIDVSMGIDLMIGAKSLANKLKITEFSFWSGVTAYVLGRLNQHSYATILTPVPKRMNLNESESVGCFSNTILLYANWDERQPIEQFLLSWQQHMTDDFCNPLVALDEIYVARTSQGAHLGGRPEVIFSLAEQNSNPLEINSNDEVNFDLRITLNNSLSAPSLRMEYLNSAYSRHMITSFAGILSYVAQQFLSDQDTELGQLKLSVSELSGERLCGNKRVAIPQVILDTAQLDGGKIALSNHESQYSYSEVILKAKSIAAYLQAVDIKKGDRVAVLMGRHCGLPITLLGVLLSGATYVPLDPDYPMSRTEYILNDVEPKIVICDENMAIGSEGIHWCEYSSLANFSSELYQSVDYDKDDISHLIYTSGSTGQPKGVMVRHGGVLALFDWAKGYYQAEEFSLVYGGTSMCFDLSVFEVFVTWAIGGRLHLATNALQLVKDLASYPISLINTVPSVLAEVLKRVSLSSSIRVVNLAGEPLPPKLAQDIYRMSDHLRVINLYGPSEDTTYSTVYQVPRDNTEEMRIGGPLDGTKVKVVDKNGRTMPPHYSGELYISGEGLALGYWNRTELTQEKFIEDDQQTRWYQTGDIVTVGDDGLLIYQGRIDNQVKLNGFRIELGEIDNLLLSLSVIKDACTILQKGERQSRIVSFVETDNQNGLAIAKHLLLEKLPAYMQPSAMIVIGKIPTTLSGKQDRSALQKRLNEEK